MVKKCNCKKCVYCELICTITSVPRINCRKFGTDMVMPSYCSQYKTKEEIVENLLNKWCDEWLKNRLK